MKQPSQNRQANRDPRRYDDIIEQKRPVSTAHPPMPVAERAAQFAPFAAVTGHGAAIDEAYLEHLAAGDGVEAIPIWEAESAGAWMEEP